MFGFRVLRVLAPLAVVCGALFAVSCGSNNSSPSSAPTTYPTSAADNVALGANAGQVQLPAVSPGNYVTLNYIGSSATPFPSPFPSAGISLNTTIYVQAPTGAPAPTSAKRAKLSLSNLVPVQYVTFTLTASLPASFISSEVLNLASTMPVNQPYFVEFDDLTTGAYINTFPGSAVNAGTVTFNNANGFLPNVNFASVTLNTTDTYLMQFYYLTTGTPATPSPSPSPISSGTLPPVPTPSPVVVATTVPLGTAQSVRLPVVAGGFVAQATIPAAGTSATNLTVSGSSTLPNTISTIGTGNSFYPLYVLGLTASGTVGGFTSPAISLTLPANISTTTYPIYGALCTDAACPANGDVTDNENVVPASVANGVVTFSAGAFKTLTSVSSTEQYIIIYSSRATPPENVTSPVPVAAGATVTIPLPTITGYSGSVTIGGLATSTSVTIAAEPGLLPNINAIVPNTQTIFYSLSLTASPHTAATPPLCGSSGCTLATLTVPASLAAAAGTASFYVEECSATACPVSTTDQLKLSSGPPAAPYTLSVPGTFGADITSLDPVNAAYLVFYYQ